MFAAQRAVNAKDYLVTEQGIDASRISVATGTTDGQTVENYLVPAGATFGTDVTGTTPVDETAVKPQVRKPLAERHPSKKARSKPARFVEQFANPGFQGGGSRNLKHFFWHDIEADRSIDRSASAPLMRGVFTSQPFSLWQYAKALSPRQKS